MAAITIDPSNKYALLLLEFESLNYEITYSKDAENGQQIIYL